MKVLILGDMFELGNDAPAEHADILRLALEHPFNTILTAGPHFATAAAGLKGIIPFPGVPQLKQYLASHQVQHAHILVKGSRGMKLEEVIEKIFKN